MQLVGVADRAAARLGRSRVSCADVHRALLLGSGEPGAPGGAARSTAWAGEAGADVVLRERWSSRAPCSGAPIATSSTGCAPTPADRWQTYNIRDIDTRASSSARARNFRSGAFVMAQFTGSTLDAPDGDAAVEVRARLRAVVARGRRFAAAALAVPRGASRSSTGSGCGSQTAEDYVLARRCASAAGSDRSSSCTWTGRIWLDQPYTRSPVSRCPVRRDGRRVDWAAIGSSSGVRDRLASPGRIEPLEPDPEAPDLRVTSPAVPAASGSAACPGPTPDRRRECRRRGVTETARRACSAPRGRSGR